MKKETRIVAYNAALHIEAYRFQGIVQPFPNHFHEYYVLGLVEDGQRYLSCKNREYLLQKGDLVLFNPGDNHACVQSDGGTLDYRGLTLSKPVMQLLAEELTGMPGLPGFSQTVVQNEEIACCFRTLHELVMYSSCEFEKEENLFLLLSLLLPQYSQPFAACAPACREEVEQVCRFMEQHFAERLSLDQLCQYAHLSKSTLLRTFPRAKGVTPYCYLENIRIGAAKKLLEQGVPPIEAALRTGFSDQSHFSNYFSRFIGLPPGAYREIFRDKYNDGGTP